MCVLHVVRDTEKLNRRAGSAELELGRARAREVEDDLEPRLCVLQQ